MRTWDDELSLNSKITADELQLSTTLLEIISLTLEMIISRPHRLSVHKL